MNDGVIGIVFLLVYVSLKEFGVVGSDTNTWGIKDFHKCWSGSLAKRRLCLGPAGVINCTPLKKKKKKQKKILSNIVPKFAAFFTPTSNV